jgi:BRCA1/BRCA2-containing complex subunit 3
MSGKYTYCKYIKITIDAYSSCLKHVFLTDSEEVMGLLLGQVVNEGQVDQTINILSTICMTRKCKEKDRVEFDELQIAKASELAEKLSTEHNTKINVVGWYHSHPNITVPPSNVDLQTQYSQQYQGPFVGLILSCFGSTNNIKLIAFQTQYVGNAYTPIYIDIAFIFESLLVKSNITNSASTYSGILRNILQEEEEQYNIDMKMIDKDDMLNRLSLLNNRQALLIKIIQNLTDPYIKSLGCEMDNMKYYLSYIKELNNLLRNTIKNYEDINKQKDDNDY